MFVRIVSDGGKVLISYTVCNCSHRLLYGSFLFLINMVLSSDLALIVSDYSHCVCIHYSVNPRCRGGISSESG